MCICRRASRHPSGESPPPCTTGSPLVGERLVSRVGIACRGLDGQGAVANVALRQARELARRFRVLLMPERGVELALLLPRHDLGLRRDYGEALIAVGRYPEASLVLEEYADTVAGPMPLEAEHARRIARQARARLN